MKNINDIITELPPEDQKRVQEQAERLQNEQDDGEALYKNFYECYECHHKWTDIWSATCDDDCPECGARHVSPYKSEDA